MPFGKEYHFKNQPTPLQIEDFFSQWIKYMTKSENLKGTIDIDMAICEELVYRYYEDLYRYETISYIKDQNIFKRMGHIAFWTRKLHPLKLYPEQGDTLSEKIAPFVNERFAFMLACICIEMETCIQIKFDENFIQDFIYHLRYKSVSPHSLSMLFHALYGKGIERIRVS